MRKGGVKLTGVALLSPLTHVALFLVCFLANIVRSKRSTSARRSSVIGRFKNGQPGALKPATPNPAFSFATSSFPLRLRDLCRRRMQPPPYSGGSTQSARKWLVSSAR